MPERIADHNRPYIQVIYRPLVLYKGKSWHCGSNKVLVHESYVRRARSAYLVHKSIFGVCLLRLKVTAYHYDTHFCWSESPIYVFSSHFFPLYLWYFHVAGVSHACRGFRRRALLPCNTTRPPPKKNSPSFSAVYFRESTQDDAKKKVGQSLTDIFLFEKNKNFPRVTFKLNLYSSLSHRVSSL